MWRLGTRVLGSLFMLGACGAASAEIVELKYEMLKDFLESKSVRLQATGLELQAAKEKQGSFGRSFLPRLEIQGAHDVFQTGDQSEKAQSRFGAELRFNLYNGGRDLIKSEIEDIDVEKKTIISAQVKAEELQEVRRVFLDIVYSQERLDLFEAAIKLNNLNLVAAERRIRSGVATESDRVEFEMKAVDLKRDLSQTKLQIEALTREMSVLLNFQKSVELVFPRKLDHNHEFESLLVHESQDHEFLYKDDELSSRQFFLRAGDFKKKALPFIEAFASFNEYNERIESAGPGTPASMRRESVVGIRLSLELENLAQSNREARAFALEASALQKQADFKKSRANVHISSELAELRFLHDQVHDAEVNIERAEKYFKLTQSEYGRGVKNSPDVLGASEKLFENRLKRLDIIRDFQRAKTHVLAKIGK